MTNSEPSDPDPVGAARAEMDRTGVTPAPGPGPHSEGPGDRIGRFTLVEEIGEGGMGTVWLARQEEPVKRRVALKVIKLGMDTREVVVRFEAERQALALMDHPHIAKVFDGGATENGRPYFAMELVEGTPITEHCDARRLGLVERLELFTKVCGAIQHAHQKGVVHRDIKPTNVLVTRQGEDWVPKVIDFGIAKATSAELTQKTLFTQHAQIIGTPEYMAPEQAEMSGLDIDTRADVYALGALLYEMLTGARVFDMREVLEAGYMELLRTIREVEPERPSTRVSTLGEAASPIARDRHVTRDELRRRLAGDLDWIVMKALEKDRTRRYESASGFAADIARYLNQEPVQAAPPSAAYRFRKFVRRRRKTVVAVSAMLFLLVAGSIGTAIGLLRAVRANAELDVALGEKDEALREEERQRGLAEDNEVRARAAEAEARAEAERATRAEEQARRRAAELEQVSEFQAEQLSEIDPQAMGIGLRASLLAAVPDDHRADLDARLAPVNFTTIALRSLQENLFGQTLDAIDAQFEDQPLVQAQLLQTLAVTLCNLGLLDLAEEPQRRAWSIRNEVLGPEHLDTLLSLNDLAYLLQDQGRLAEAEPLYREVLEARRRILGDEHSYTLTTAGNLGVLLVAMGRLDEAEPLYRETLDGKMRAHGPDHPSTLIAVHNMGYLLKTLRRYEEAEAYYLEGLAGDRRVLGDDHPSTLVSLNALGTMLQSQGRYEEAEPLLREAYEGRSRVLGDDHPDTLLSTAAVGLLLSKMGRHAEGESYARRALEGYLRVLGGEHPAALRGVANVGVILVRAGRYEEGEPYCRRAYFEQRRVLGEEHRHTVAARNVLGQTYTHGVDRARERGDELTLGRFLGGLGSFYLETGNPGAAIAPLEEAVGILAGALPEEDERAWIAMSDLGLALARTGAHADAEPWMLESAEWALSGAPDRAALARAAGAYPPVDIVARAIDFYRDWHHAEPAAGQGAAAEELARRRQAWLDRAGG